ATFGVPAEYAESLRQGVTPGPATPMGRIMRGERIVEVLDLIEDEGYRVGDAVPRAAVEIGGFRSMVFVALIRDEKLLGAFAIGRRFARFPISRSRCCRTSRRRRSSRWRTRA